MKRCPIKLREIRKDVKERGLETLYIAERQIKKAINEALYEIHAEAEDEPDILNENIEDMAELIGVYMRENPLIKIMCDAYTETH